MMAHILRGVLVAAASFLTYKILGLLFDLGKHYFKGQGGIYIYRDRENKSYLHNQNKSEEHTDEKSDENNEDNDAEN